MKLVSPVLKHIIYPGLSRMGFLRRLDYETPAVVTYHGVFPSSYRPFDVHLDGNLVTAESLRRQLQLLKARYNVITPEEFLSWCRARKPLPPRSVLLTCDDGLQNVLTSMLPVLQEQALSCLFFVTGASLKNEPSMLWYEELYLMLLDGPETYDFEFPGIVMPAHPVQKDSMHSLWWNLVKRFSQFDSHERALLLQQAKIQLGLPERWNSTYMDDAILRARFCTLTLEELHQLANSGMAIGSHTLSHPVLSQQSPEFAWSEISESQRTLEQSLNCEIWAMAYPFGDAASASSREFEMAERAGLECAFVNVEETSVRKASSFAFPRIHVTAQMSLSEFEAHVSGFYRSMRRRLDFFDVTEVRA